MTVYVKTPIECSIVEFSFHYPNVQALDMFLSYLQVVDNSSRGNHRRCLLNPPF